MSKEIQIAEQKVAGYKQNVALCKANCATHFAHIERCKERKYKILGEFYESSFDSEAEVLKLYRSLLSRAEEELRVLRMADYYHTVE